MQTTQETSHPIEPMFAVINGSEEITEEMYQEVLDFIAYLKEKGSEEQ